MQTQRRSFEAGSEASYYGQETWEDWGSRSSLSQVEEVATQSTCQDDVATLKAERDALAQALATERQRAASAARATDARLAELHGVIAELVRRRAADKSAIVEESDECESTTQPAGELDNDADQSRTDQNDSSSLLSPEPVTPQEERHVADVEDTNTDTSTPEPRQDGPGPDQVLPDHSWRQSGCDLDPESSGCLHPPTKGRCSSRQAKLASRVRLRRTEDSDSTHKHDECWCLEACEKLALDVCSQAAGGAGGGRHHAESPLSLCVSRLCSARADLCVLSRALARANHTAQRLSLSCAALESWCVSCGGALRAADQAIEVYDVLLALAETGGGGGGAQREAAEQVACQLLQRLESETPRLGDRIVSPGPWQMHRPEQSCVEWSVEVEKSLRRRAAQLKADTVRLRHLAPEPHFFSYYDPEEDDFADSVNNINIAEMEAAVMVQEVMSSREAAALARLRDSQTPHQERPLAATRDNAGTNQSKHKTNSSRRREHARAAETDL